MKLWKGIVVLVVLVAVNVLVQSVVCRWDMTDDKRYSISAPTKALLQELDAPLEVSILLDGDLNPGFQRLKKATYEMVEELGVYSGDNWKIKQLSNETIGLLEEEIREQLQPIVIHERTHKGQTAQTTVYPYVMMDYIGQTIVIPLLKNQPGLSGEENLNHSIENLEYAIMEGIRTLVQDTVERIAFLEGHGELDEYDVYDITRALARYYQVDRGALGVETGVLDGYKAVIIADPQIDFSEVDKYIIDQYVMQGGRVLWLLNGVQFSKDYLSSQGTTPIVGLDLKLNDMLFRYGVRINHTLVQDLQCLPIPVDVSQDASVPNWQPMPWTYAPLLLTSQASPITRNVAQVKATMASAVDIVGGDDGIRKEILLATSSASKLTSAPAQVDLSFGHTQDETFSYSFVPVAVSLEGVFPSVFAHQLPPEGLQLHAPLRKQSSPTKQIVVASGSIIRNDWQKNEPLPLGYDRYTQMQFGNRDFIVNSVLYLTDDQGWMQLREKEFTLRLINDQRAREMRITAQIISIVIPLAILVLTGGIIIGIRKKKIYTTSTMKLAKCILLGMSIWLSGMILAQSTLDYPLDTIEGQVYYRYTVERSIGLYRISKNFGVSQEAILQANPHLQTTGLRYDEIILVPAYNLYTEAVGAQSTVDKVEPVVVAEEKKEEKKPLIKHRLFPRKNIKQDTIAVEEAIMVDSVIVSNDSSIIRLAMLLPLQAEAIKRDKNIDRFYDYYAGALIAINEVQATGKKIEVFTYDVGKTAQKTIELLNDSTWTHVDAMIGPAYSQQVNTASTFAKADSTWLLVPFLSNVVDVAHNPYMLQFNPSEQTEADTLARYLAQYGDSVNCVLIEAKSGDVIPSGILALHQALEAHHVPTSTISLTAILTDSLDGAFKADMENIVIFNTEKYGNLQAVMPHLLKGYTNYRITLFSHYSWQNEKIIIPQIYTSVFSDSVIVTEAYKNVYEQYFNHPLSSTQPRYDLLGYDQTRHLLDLLSHSTDTIDTQLWYGSQSDILYKKVSADGGYENQLIHIIRK